MPKRFLVVFGGQPGLRLKKTCVSETELLSVVARVDVYQNQDCGKLLGNVLKNGSQRTLCWF